MKKSLFLLFFFIPFMLLAQQQNRIESLKNQLESLKVDNPGLSEQAKIDINVNNISLANFILAISNAHDVNINIAPELNQTTIANNNFSNVTVADLLVFLCKEYDLTIDFIGNILSIKKYIIAPEIPAERIIPITYNPNDNTLTIDAKDDRLYDVFKRIIDESGKNLVFTPGIENKTLSSYIKEMPFDAAMDKLALANNLFVEKTKDNFYVFEGYESNFPESGSNNQVQNVNFRRNFHFEILDAKTKLLEVDFTNTPIANIISDIGNALKINIFTATPLNNADTTTFRAKSISFDELLVKIFETYSVHGMIQGNVQNQNTNTQASNSSERFTFK